MVKKESGGGLDYASYVIAMFITVLVAFFLIYHQKLIAVKEEIKNRLQICESYVLTCNQYDMTDDLGSVSVERELQRAHIITEYNTAGNALERKEGLQVRGIANKFAEQVKKSFQLDAMNLPVDNIFDNVNGEDADGTITISGFIIYEAVYDEDGNITNFIAYDVIFSSNVYVSCTKTILPGEFSVDGKELQGSTLYASLDFCILSADHYTKYPVTVSSSVDIIRYNNSAID